VACVCERADAMLMLLWLLEIASKQATSTQRPHARTWKKSLWLCISRDSTLSPGDTMMAAWLGGSARACACGRLVLLARSVLPSADD
jgi:hypothetical protein